MKLKDSLIVWRDKTDQGNDVAVGPLLNNVSWSHAYPYSSGGCYRFVEALDEKQSIIYVLAEALRLISEYGLDSKDVCQEMLKIDEF